MTLQKIDKTIEALGVFAFFASSSFIFLNALNRYLIFGLFRNIAKNFESLRPLYFSVRSLLGSIVVTADEIPGLLLVWVSFLGAYLTMRERRHIALDLLLRKLNPPFHRLFMVINTILISSFFVLLLWQSLRMMKVAGTTSIETAEIAQGWFMLIMPVVALLMLVAQLRRFFVKKKEN